MQASLYFLVFHVNWPTVDLKLLSSLGLRVWLAAVCGTNKQYHQIRAHKVEVQQVLVSPITLSVSVCLTYLLSLGSLFSG